MKQTNRREFLKETGTVLTAGVALGAAWGLQEGASSIQAAEDQTQSSTNQQNKKSMKIVIAADPFAVSLKKSIAAYLKEKGHEVIDVGSTEEKEIPYYECGPVACKVLQQGKADRAILMCGTGMGMSIVANRFKGVTASVVESVFAAKMCRAINNANALCLGSMIWGDWMAKEAVEVFLTTNLADGLPQFADFLKQAEKKVAAITPGQ
jgi:ribose 5-phosphate isomerase B